MSKWRKANPDKVVETRKRYWNKKRNDPVWMLNHPRTGKTQKVKVPHEPPLSWSAYYLRRTFGLEMEDFEAMAASQGGVCAICNRPPTPQKQRGVGKKFRLCIDHDHNTGRIRGLLCDTCNRGLGLFGDSVEGVSSALEYLLRAATNPSLGAVPNFKAA